MLVRSCYGARCRVCSTPKCGCGGVADLSIAPLDTITEGTMSDAKGHPVYEYDAVVNGYETILNLTEEEAEKRFPGAKRRSGPVATDHPEHEHGSAAPAAAKARTAPNK